MGRLQANIDAGVNEAAALSDDMLITLEAYCRFGIELPPPRVRQAIVELQQRRADPEDHRLRYVGVRIEDYNDLADALGVEPGEFSWDQLLELVRHCRSGRS